MNTRNVQTTSTLVMVRPAHFGFNEQTAESNAFQHQTQLPASEVHRRALQEFDDMVSQLRSAGIEVVVFEDSPEPVKPDAIFPNNWISFHRNGNVVLYPMQAANRRVERRQDIPEYFLERYPHATLIDLSHYEQENLFLEGTGSMVMDRVNQLVYMCISPRSSMPLFEEFCSRLGIEGVAFHGVDEQGQAIYHTNVMMAMGHKFAVICLEAITDPEEKAFVTKRLVDTGHEVIPISLKQTHHFAGNLLQVYNHAGEPKLVMSERAFRSFTPDQIARFKAFTDLLVIPIDTVETFGGGGVRCMLAEVFY
ncbi:MAG: arginine deiminase-related protein [Bacteroidota bacterium]